MVGILELYLFISYFFFRKTGNTIDDFVKRPQGDPEEVKISVCFYASLIRFFKVMRAEKMMAEAQASLKDAQAKAEVAKQRAQEAKKTAVESKARHEESEKKAQDAKEKLEVLSQKEAELTKKEKVATAAADEAKAALAEVKKQVGLFPFSLLRIDKKNRKMSNKMTNVILSLLHLITF